jgi:hypothetical protein
MLGSDEPDRNLVAGENLEQPDTVGCAGCSSQREHDGVGAQRPRVLGVGV